MSIVGYSRDNKEARYAYRFVTHRNLDWIFQHDNNSFIRFRIYCVDSLSGFGKVFEVDYRAGVKSIADGDFAHGNTSTIGESRHSLDADDENPSAPGTT